MIHAYSMGIIFNAYLCHVNTWKKIRRFEGWYASNEPSVAKCFLRTFRINQSSDERVRI